MEKTENPVLIRKILSFRCGKPYNFRVDKAEAFPRFPYFPLCPHFFHFTDPYSVENLSLPDPYLDAFNRIGKRGILRDHLRDLIAGGDRRRVVVPVE